MLARLEFVLEEATALAVEGATILEIGCGDTPLAATLAEKGFKYIGIDASKGILKKSAANSTHPNVHFILGDAERLPLKAHFDLLVCTEVIEHLPTPERLLSQLGSLLKSRGRLLITVPNGRAPRELYHQVWSWFRPSNSLDRHSQHFTSKRLQRLLNNHGFVVEVWENESFVSEVFPLWVVTRRVAALAKLDRKFAKLLPRALGSTWHIRARKVEDF